MNQHITLTQQKSLLKQRNNRTSLHNREKTVRTQHNIASAIAESPLWISVIAGEKRNENTKRVHQLQWGENVRETGPDRHIRCVSGWYKDETH